MVKTIPYRGDFGRNLSIVSLRTGGPGQLLLRFAQFTF